MVTGIAALLTIHIAVVAETVRTYHAKRCIER